MRTLAIGDIHGCLGALDVLLSVISPTARDTLVMLGDYIDRGPDSCGVLERLLSLQDHIHLVTLRGNHEVMMRKARLGGSAERDWLDSGGEATLASYGIPKNDPEWPERIPAGHWRFMEQDCIDLWETDTHFFVHASAHCDVPLNEQSTYDLHWGHFEKARPHVSGKTMICGHTSQKNGLPADKGFAVCIDTYAHGSGWLTCLEVETGRYWQANQAGEIRERIK